MPNVSPFQILPLHIAEAIGNYCIGLYRHLLRYTFINERTEKTWLVLHDVSYSWMQLARRNLNESVTLRLSTNTENDQFATTLHSRSVIEQRTAIIPHVKRVVIVFDNIVEKPNKEDIEKLNRVWPEELVFPKARSLNCYLWARYTNASDNAMNDKYFKWFVERVQSSFPNLQRTTIEFGEYGMLSVSPGVLLSKEWNAGLFLSALSRTAMWDINGISDLAYMDNEHILIQNSPELTSFSCSECLNYEFASWITKKSANTLEKLDYGDESSGGFEDILFDDDGHVIVYPRLRRLLVCDSSDDKGELTTDKSIVLFPALQHLKMYCSCVFKDDTLFRGLNDTLISLFIGLHRGFVDIFRKHKMCSPGSYPNILDISARLEHRNGLTLSADEFAEAAFGLVSPATQSMMIGGGIPYSHIASIIPTCPYVKNIQILHLNIRLSLLEVLGVLKHFPNVTDFGCPFRGIDSELHAIQHELIPSHLGTQYSQLSSRLQRWHLWNSEDASAEEMAALFVTLAVLCPNFTLITGWEERTALYDNEIGHIINSGLYEQHAERLRHFAEP